MCNNLKMLHVTKSASVTSEIINMVLGHTSEVLLRLMEFSLLCESIILVESDIPAEHVAVTDKYN